MENKTYTLRFRSANRATFEAIRGGSKRVETRAATIKYHNVKRGDTVLLVCGRNKFKKRVKRARIFRTITAMLRSYKIKDIEPKLSSVKELREVYYGYPNYRDKIKKFGLIAMELE